MFTQIHRFSQVGSRIGRAVGPALVLALGAGSAIGQVCPSLGVINAPNPTASGWFGHSGAMSFGGLNNRPLMVVGEPQRDVGANSNDRGGFTVYEHNGSSWVNIFGIINTSGQDFERLGHNVGFADPWIIAGAYAFSMGQGRAVVYRRPSNGSGYAAQATLIAQDVNSMGNFGAAVAITGQQDGWAIVGAPNHTVFGFTNESGAVYVFTRNAVNNTWNQVWTMQGTEASGSSFAHRGSSVAISQSTPYAAFSTPDGTMPGQPGSHGFVQVVTRQADGAISPTVAMIRASSPEINEDFGRSIAIEGDVLVVGAPREDFSGLEALGGTPATDSGAVYVFEKMAGNWTQIQKFRAPIPTSSTFFGSKVAFDGERIVVAGNGNSTAHVYRKVNGTWVHQARFEDPSTSASSNYGSALGVQGEHIMIGDSWEDPISLLNAGSVYTARLPDAPQGDVPADAIAVGSGDQTGCTDAATPTPYATATCGSSSASNDVWFRFTPMCSGNAIFDTFGSGFDTVLSVHSQPPNAANAFQLACNDDASFQPPNNRASLVTFDFTGGEDYYIRVGGFQAASGQFTLRHLFTYPSTPDNCANAPSVAPGSTFFHTCTATGSSNLPINCGAGNATNDVWFKYVATQSGSTRISTCGSLFDTVLAVYQSPGCPFAGSPALACNDDITSVCDVPSSNFWVSSVTINAVQGQTYYIRVGGYDPNDVGDGQINITPPTVCDSLDFNNDGSSFDPQDIDAFLSVFSEGPCIPGSATCNDIDFNNDGSLFDPCDIDAFLLVFSEGPCTLCGE